MMAGTISVADAHTNILEYAEKARAARKAHNDAVSAVDEARAAEALAAKAVEDAEYDFNDACDALMDALDRQAER